MVTRKELEAHASTLGSPYKTEPKYSAEEVRTLQRENPNVLVDVFKGSIHGIEKALQNTWNTVDWATFDALPDWENTVTDAPQTTAGALASGITQFATVFAPTSILINTLAKGAQAGSALAFAGAIPRQVSALSAAGKTTQAMLLNAAWSGGVAGPIADFVAFAEDESRLSNLIQDTRFANPITEFLAAKEGDGVFEGRLKNVIEGALTGGVLSLTFDTLSRSLRRAHKVKTAVEAGVAPEEAITKALQEIPEPAPIPRKILVEEGDRTYARPNPAFEGAAEEIVPPKLSKEREALAKEYASMADRTDAEEFLGTVKQSFEDSADENLNVNPRKLTNAERTRLGMTKGYPNMSVFDGTDDSLIRIFHAADSYGMVKPDPTNPKMAKVRARDMEEMGKILGLKRGDFTLLIAKAKRQPEIIHAAGRTLRLARNIGMKAASEIKEKLGSIAELSDKVSARTPAVGNRIDDDLLREVTSMVRQTAGLIESARDGFSAFGFELRNAKEVIDPKRSSKTAFQWTALDELSALSQAGITDANRAKVTTILKEIKDVMGKADPLDAMDAINKWQKSNILQKVGQVGREYFMNSILSNPASWVANGTGGLMMAGIKPLESAFGAKLIGAGGKMVKDDAIVKGLIQDSIDTMTEFYSGIAEAFEVWKRTGGEGIINGGKMEDFQNFSAIQQSLKDRGAIAELTGKVLTIPSRVMGATDAVTKIAAYRAKARVALRRKAAKAGIPAEAVSEYVEESLEKMTTRRAEMAMQASIQRHLPDAVSSGAPDIAADLGARIDVEAKEIQELLKIHDEAVRYGEEITFSQRGGEGFFQTTGSMVARWVNDNPAFGFMIPFIRTPANIAQFTWDRSFGMVMQLGAKQLQSLFPGLNPTLEGRLFSLTRELSDMNPAVRADAVGRVATASMLMTTFATTVALMDTDGLPRVTGKGPSDKEERRSMEEAGWQPYSIRVGDKYIAYNRLDPIASLLGMVADYADVSARMATDPSNGVLEAFTIPIVASLARNITSKTYMQGIQNLVDIATGDERKISVAAGGLVGGFIPSIIAGQTGAVDEDMREIRGVLDRIMARVPGMSDNLPPRRNLMGEKVKRVSSTGFTALDAFLPVRMSNISDDVISREVARLKFGFHIPGITQKGIDLTDSKYFTDGQDAYDRYMELSGKIKVGGLDMRQALRKAINDPYYRSLPESFDELGNKSPRVDVINSVMSKYRREAWKKLLSENKQLRDDLKEVSAVTRRPTLLR